MGVKIKDSTNLKKIEKALVPNLEREIKIALLDGVALIKTRAAQGRGFKGPFKAYSPMYREIRAEGGRPTSPPDLRWTGAMFRNLNVRTRKAGKKIRAFVGFSDATEAAKAKFNDGLRPFLGFTTEDLSYFERRIIENIKGKLR